MRITRRLAVHRTRPVMRMNEGNGHHHTAGTQVGRRHCGHGIAQPATQHTGETNMAKVFLAGATGAIGKRLVPQLLDAGCEVFGTTRSERKVAELKTAGVTPIVVDVFDAPALSRAMT